MFFYETNKINYRHRLTQINTDEKSNAVSPAQQIKEKISVNPCLKQKEVILYIQQAMKPRQ